MSEDETVLDQLNREEKSELREFYIAAMFRRPDSVDDVVMSVARNTSDSILSLPPDNASVRRTAKELAEEADYSLSTIYRVKQEFEENFGDELVDFDDGQFIFDTRLLLAAKAVDELMERTR